MAAPWPVVALAKSEKRRELKLGKEVSKNIEETGLDPNVFSLVGLNFLEISNTCLPSLPDDLGNLANLTNLVLQGNALKTLPASVGNLSKLKYLDISHNQLETLPSELSKLGDLQTLNALMNRLTDFPDVSGLKSLHILNISHNKLTALPQGIGDEALVHLSQIIVNNNAITTVPDDLSNLPHLNVLDLSNNQIEELPNELSDCSRLKELKLSGNKIKDRKLTKFAEQNSLKQVMQFLAAAKEKAAASGDKKDKKAKPKKKKKTDKEVEEVSKNLMKVLRFPSSGGLVVKVEAKVAAVRPYIVCCVLHDLDFHQSLNKFKNFITRQTRLHEDLCQKRQAATIATHDLDLVKGPLTYTSKPPTEIMIIPLFKSKETSAADYYKGMQQEADALRKEKKRSTVSGVHKFLDLLKDKDEFPCLLDAEGQAISFPPLTNSDKTKISKETRRILVEVTSSVSLDMCKKVMDEVVKQSLEMGIGKPQEGGEGAKEEASAEEDEVVFSSGKNQLVVQQVRVEDADGGLKVLYPSRTDLGDESYEVDRE